MHDVRVRHVAVGEDDQPDAVGRADALEVVLGDDGNPVGVAWASQRGRVLPPRDAGDLCRGERDDLEARIVAERHVEVVEVAPCGADDDHARRPVHGAVDTARDRARSTG